MLSAETTLLPGARNNTEKKKRKHTPSNLPDGSGWGDHIQLLQIYELWDQTDYSIDWCKENNLQVRGMMFVKNVRGQLTQIMQKMAKESLDVQTSRRHKKSQQDYKILRKALCTGYANQLAERMIRHNGYRTLGFKSQLVQVHPSSVLKADEDGMLPNYVVYHELISTTRPFMRNVCAVEMQWVVPILGRLEKLNIKKLSGGSDQPEERIQEENSNLEKKVAAHSEPPEERDSRIQAARARFLARKAQK
nr:probable pre-mRNA-splicing factor ATP-dependent RNA helicase DEAH4 isoform X2 [Ipomoea batatas]